MGKPGYSPAVNKRISDEIANGWELLDLGDVDGARAALERARALADREVKGRGSNGAGGGADADPDILFLGGVIAEHEGEFETAMEACLRAHAIDPEEPAYPLYAAEIALGAFDQPEAAIELCDKALDLVTEDEELVGAILLKVEALISLGNPEGEDSEARELLDELAGCALEDPAIWCRLGDLRLALGDMDAAEQAYSSAVNMDEGYADALHGLGMIYQERGDNARMVDAWQRVRTLDLAAPPPELHLDAEEFERVAEAALAELPQLAIDRLENVPVLVEDVPSEELVADGVDPRLLGLFSGVPLSEKSSVGGQVPTLDAIHLFQRNLERLADNLDDLAEEIRITVLHETAHFFGLDDDDLEGMGLG